MRGPISTVVIAGFATTNCSAAAGSGSMPRARGGDARGALDDRGSAGWYANVGAAGGQRDRTPELNTPPATTRDAARVPILEQRRARWSSSV